MQRVFARDVLECPACGGRMRVIAAIEQPRVIEAILRSHHLATRAPPIASARASEPGEQRIEPLVRGVGGGVQRHALQADPLAQGVTAREPREVSQKVDDARDDAEECSRP